ncbi:MAG: hypothetical protein IJ385_01435, partial [Ruminiclostridium sp.]|nr:hypothetical protein [Ruminiclostridium sp.]
TSTTTTTVITTAETTPPVDYSTFSLLDYYGDFDEAEPMSYTMLDIESVTEDANKNRLEIALKAVKNTDYYTDVIKQAEELFAYENGEITAKEESFLNWGYEDCLEYDETEGFVVNPQLKYSLSLKFDNENTESVFVFRLPLTYSGLEWSGTSDFYVPVYVNSDNDPHILCDAAAQSLYGTSIIQYEDECHVIFDRGHSQGTARAHIYSFENGEPKLEYEGSHINYHSKGLFFIDDQSGGAGIARTGFFRDKLRDCYCGVKAFPLDGEAEQAVINSEKVRTEFGDIARLYVVGGQYLFIPMHECYTFENGALIKADIGINCTPDEKYFDTILNIDLSKYV